MFDCRRGSGTEVIDEALAALVALRGDDLASVQPTVLGDRLVGLAAIVEAASAELVRVTGRWDAEQGWAFDGAGSAVGWFTHQSTCNRATAGRWVRSGRLAHRHRRVGDALASGDLNVAQLDALAHAATRERDDLFAEHLDVLLGTARQFDTADFAGLIRTWEHLADDHLGRNDPARRHAQRGLRLMPTFGDMYRIDGLLDAECAGRLKAGLDHLDRPDPAGTTNPRSRATRDVDNLNRLLRQWHEGDTGHPGITITTIIDFDLLTRDQPCTPQHPHQPNPPHTRHHSDNDNDEQDEQHAGHDQPDRHDHDRHGVTHPPAPATDSRAPDTNDQGSRPPDGNGHHDNSHHGEAHDDRDIDPAVGTHSRPERAMRSRPRPHVAPLPGLPRLDARHHTLGLGPAPVATIQRLLCNSHLNRVILGPDGRVLDFGRRTRLFSPAQRIAVLIRDGYRCAYPGCANHDHLEVHHLNPYEHGGHTTIDNGVALCESDHHRCHEGGHTLTRNRDGTYTATAPDPRRPRPPPHRR